MIELQKSHQMSPRGLEHLIHLLVSFRTSRPSAVMAGAIKGLNEQQERSVTGLVCVLCTARRWLNLLSASFAGWCCKCFCPAALRACGPTIKRRGIPAVFNVCTYTG